MSDQPGSAETVPLEDEIVEFDRAMIALRCSDLVWRDVWRRWMRLRRVIAAPVTLDRCQPDSDGGRATAPLSPMDTCTICGAAGPHDHAAQSDGTSDGD